MEFTDKYLKWIILGVVGLVGIVLLIIGLNSCKNDDITNTTTTTTQQKTTLTTTTRVPDTTGTATITSTIDLNPMR